MKFRVTKRLLSLTILSALIFSCLSTSLTTNAEGEAPAIIWASDPTAPGQTLAVQGYAFTNGTAAVRVGRINDTTAGAPSVTPLVPQQRDVASLLNANIVQLNDYSLSAVIPSTLSNGILCSWITTSGGTSRPIVLNRATPEWAEGQYVQKGKSLRVFGRNLSGPSVKAYIQSKTRGGGQFINVSNCTDYAAAIDIPASLPDGDYYIWIHNGFGGNFGWGSPITVTIADDPRASWPSTPYDVTSYGADKTGKSDSTAAIQKALDAARNNGGGIVYLPNGTYEVDGTLEVFAKTRLMGESKTGVILKDSLAAGYRNVLINGDTAFGIENLSIDVSKCYKAVAAPKYMANRALGIMWWYPTKVRNPANPWPNPWKPSDDSLNVYSYKGVSKDFYVSNTSIKNSVPMNARPADMNASITCIANAGDNTLITNNDLTSDGNITDLYNCYNLKVASNNYSYITANNCETNAQGCCNVVWEKNNFDGMANKVNNADASGMFFQYGCYKTENLYIAENYVHDVVGGNRGEGICFDGAPSESGTMLWATAASAASTSVQVDLNKAYCSKSSPVSSNANYCLPVIRNSSLSQYAEYAGYFDNKLDTDYMIGNTIAIIAGKGKGQMRQIISNTANTINIDKQWDVIPDTSSVILVGKMAKNALIVNNKIERCERPILMWSHCTNLVTAGNYIDQYPVRNNPGDTNVNNWGITESSVAYPPNSINGRFEGFNYIVNNTVNAQGMFILSDAMVIKDPGSNTVGEGTLFMRSVYRDNILNNGLNIKIGGWASDYNGVTQSLPEIDGLVFDHNILTNGDADVVINSTDAASVANTVIYSNRQDLAKGKPTSSSCYAWDCVSSNGNDGNPTTFWHSSVNSSDTKPVWWQVDLGSSKQIGGFELDFFNGTAYTGERKNFKIEGSNDPNFASGVVLLAEQGSDAAGGSTWRADSLNTSGSFRYIRASKTVKESGDPYTNIYWAFRDFRVFGYTPTPVQSNILSQGMSASASSYSWDCYASNGNDGISSTFWHSSVNGTDNPLWWQVDLGSAKNISGFELDFYHDSAYSGERRNFKVEGSNDPNFATGVTLLAQQGSTVVQSNTWSATSGDTASTFRYIRVTKTVREAGDSYGTIYWCFRELRVYGH